MKLSIENLKKLQQKKYRTEFGCFIAEGAHLVQELLSAAQRNPALREASVYLAPDYVGDTGGLPSYRLELAQIAKVCDTKTPQGIFAVVPSAALLSQQSMSSSERVVYLSEVQDPGNLGTILRTLAWFGGSRCVLSPGSVDPFNPKVVRASMGAIFHVPIETDVALGRLRALYPRLACLAMNGEAISSKHFADFDAYVFGNEARGLPAGLDATAFTIPGGDSIESLNLATAVSLCAYELSR
jgi:TrmH family RNA methyltransferase